MTIVAIMGLGLMGGSLGLALKQRGGYEVHGYTRSAPRGARAVERGAVDAIHDDPRPAVAGADLVVLCAPILAIPGQLERVRDHLKPGAIVTDVGSTKQDVQAACRELLAGRDACFVGSHPIAGSEQQGVEAARADLYDNALVVVTPDADTPPAATERVTGTWKDTGARIQCMDAAEHDRILALTSHLPHVAAALLSAVVGRPGLRPDIGTFCGTGFLDTTRVAEGGVDIWLDIIKTNRESILNEMVVFREICDRFIEKLDRKDFVAIEKALEEGRAFRQSFDT